MFQSNKLLLFFNKLSNNTSRNPNPHKMSSPSFPFKGEREQDTSAILQLPEELILDIMDWVYTATARQNIWSLSLTCKTFARMTRPIAFRSLKLSRLPSDPKQLPSLYAPMTRQLILEDTVGDAAGQLSLTTEYIRRLPMLRQLVFILLHARNYVHHQEKLVKAIETLSNLHSISFFQSDPGFSDPTLVYKFSVALLARVAPRLGHLKIAYGNTNLPPELMSAIVDQATSLKSLAFNQGIPVDWEYFAADRNWACAASLTRFEARNCRGLHATVFSHFVTRGAWPNLNELVLDSCGRNSDDVNLIRPPFSQWMLNVPALRRFNMNHFSRWEMMSLSRIRAYTLEIQDLSAEAFVEVLGLEGAWSNLERLIINSDRIVILNEQDKALVQICCTRDIQLQCL